MAAAGISIAAYVLFFCIFRKKIVEQQFAFLIVFLASVTAVGELDVVLPIYFVFSFLPFIKKLRYMSKFTFVMMAYVLTYLIAGIAFQNTARTIATFIAKVWQFVIFFLVYDEALEIKEGKWISILWISLIVETLLSVYLLQTQTRVDSLSGLVRLGNNGQPITGNISTVAIILMVYLYISNRGNRRTTFSMLLLSIGYLIWIVLSGTRGYMLEYVAALILIFCDYFTNGEIGAVTQKRRYFTIIGLGAAAIMVVVIMPEVTERLSSVLRVRASVGIRTYENAAVKDFFLNSPVYTQLLGIGLGGTGNSHVAMHEALQRQFSLGMWSRNYYLNTSGALFHNLYANILMNLGLIGIIGTIIVFYKMWRRITVSCGENLLARRAMHLFEISFFLMNYYRWSAVCGIAEMIIFALMLKQIRKLEKTRSRTA